MRVHQLAKSLGVTLDTVRFYTRIKVLQPEKRKANGYHDGTIIEDTSGASSAEGSIMQILVINAGSSSVKFSVFEGQEQLFKSSLDKLEDIPAAVEQIPDILRANGFANPQAVAHRVAHGGNLFKDVRLIDDAVISSIEVNIPLLFRKFLKLTY